MSNLPLRERVARERRRLKSVRHALSVALEKGARGDAGYLPFYVAEGDYIEAAMHRLHIQDVRMGEMIRSRLGAPLDASAEQALGDLDTRLGDNQRHLRELIAARDALRAEGAAAVDRFEKVSRAYTAYITANMGHHGAITELAQKLFSMDDWAYMAGVTEAETQREQQLYDRVFATLPTGVTAPVEA